MSQSRKETLASLLAHAQMSYAAYQMLHWKVAGKSFYGNHLMLQRLYEESQAYTDSLGERLLGLEGDDLDLSLADQATRVDVLMKKVAGDEDAAVIDTALKVATALHKQLAKAYDTIKAQDMMTLGLDDLIMATSSKVEEHMYLLQQALRERNPEISQVSDLANAHGVSSQRRLKNKLMR